MCGMCVLFHASAIMSMMERRPRCVISASNLFALPHCCARRPRPVSTSIEILSLASSMLAVVLGVLMRHSCISRDSGWTRLRMSWLVSSVQELGNFACLPVHIVSVSAPHSVWRMSCMGICVVCPGRVRQCLSSIWYIARSGCVRLNACVARSRSVVLAWFAAFLLLCLIVSCSFCVGPGFGWTVVRCVVLLCVCPMLRSRLVASRSSEFVCSVCVVPEVSTFMGVSLGIVGLLSVHCVNCRQSSALVVGSHRCVYSIAMVMGSRSIPMLMRPCWRSCISIMPSLSSSMRSKKSSVVRPRDCSVLFSVWCAVPRPVFVVSVVGCFVVVVVV